MKNLKMKLHFRYFSKANVLFLFTSVLVGCSASRQTLDLQKGQELESQRDYKQALKFYAKVIRRDPNHRASLEAARHGAVVAEIHVEDFNSAIEYLDLIVRSAPEASERKRAKQKSAEIYLSRLNKPDLAIKEFQGLLTNKLPEQDLFQIHMSLAKAYAQIGNPYQAKVEAREALKKAASEENKFEAQFFVANLTQTKGESNEAVLLYKDLMAKFPRQSEKYNVAVSLAGAIEDQQNFKGAIEVLESAKLSYPNPEFLDLKIKRLKERLENMPGAFGLKK